MQKDPKDPNLQHVLFGARPRALRSVAMESNPGSSSGSTRTNLFTRAAAMTAPPRRTAGEDRTPQTRPTVFCSVCLHDPHLATTIFALDGFCTCIEMCVTHSTTRGGFARGFDTSAAVAQLEIKRTRSSAQGNCSAKSF